jgi:hypothetical protein
MNKRAFFAAMMFVALFGCIGIFGWGFIWWWSRPTLTLMQVIHEFGLLYLISVIALIGFQAAFMSSRKKKEVEEDEDVD